MTKVKVFKGRNVNLQSMRKKQSEAAIEDDTTTLSQAIEMKVIATNEQKEIVQKGEELRDAKILDINAICIDGDDEKSKKYRKKAAKKL